MKLVLHPTTEQHIERLIEHPPHAILLTGPVGMGKRSLAFYLAAKMLGTDPGRIEQYPYLTVIETPDATMSIDAIRGLQHDLSLKKASDNPRRIALLLDGHKMSDEAQNALLKTLEEPPTGAVIIISASSASNLLPTVRSRVQEIVVNTPEQVRLQQYFEQAGYKAADIFKAQSLSGGLPGLMHALLAEDTSHPLYEATTQARIILSNDPYDRLVLVDVLAKNKQRCLDICFVLGQMAHVALQSSRSAAKQQRWRNVLSAAFEATDALGTNAGTKLVMTNLMLAL